MPSIYVDTETLIETLESEGYVVSEQYDDTKDYMRDEIYNLYRDFVQWDNNEIPDNGFVLSLKKFFKEHLDKTVL